MVMKLTGSIILVTLRNKICSNICGHPNAAISKQNETQTPAEVLKTNSVVVVPTTLGGPHVALMTQDTKQ